ncbi:MAG: lysophospholipase [Deltaproteobacteria bacterium]|nr:lysophospholipase [Deltaproteobacteria bacterium]
MSILTRKLSKMETIAAIVVGIPLLFYSYVFAAQEKLLFRGAATEPGIEEYIKKTYPLNEELTITADSGAELRGYFVRQLPGKKHPVLIFFGGNGEDSTWFAADAEKLPGYSVAAFNYRGYGKSTGEPTEKNLYADALKIYDTIAARDDVDPTKIFIVGRSLGTGVAVYLASQRKAAGVVLVSPYDSMVKVAGEHLSFVPVSILLKHRFKAVTFAPNIKSPLIAFLTEHDEVIAHERSLALIHAWGGEKAAYLLRGTTHNTFDQNDAFWEETNKFLSDIEKKDSQEKSN